MERYTFELFKSTLIMHLTKKYGNSKPMSGSRFNRALRVLQDFHFKKSAFIGEEEWTGVDRRKVVVGNKKRGETVVSM